jgi:hypothetical protein
MVNITASNDLMLCAETTSKDEIAERIRLLALYAAIEAAGAKILLSVDDLQSSQNRRILMRVAR